MGQINRLDGTVELDDGREVGLRVEISVERAIESAEFKELVERIARAVNEA